MGVFSLVDGREWASGLLRLLFKYVAAVGAVRHTTSDCLSATPADRSQSLSAAGAEFPVVADLATTPWTEWQLALLPRRLTAI
jgi:hypothetical protein